MDRRVSTEPRPRRTAHFDIYRNNPPDSYKKLLHHEPDLARPQPFNFNPRPPSQTVSFFEALTPRVLKLAFFAFLFLLMIFVLSLGGKSCLEEYNDLGCAGKSSQDKECKMLLKCLQNDQNWLLGY